MPAPQHHTFAGASFEDTVAHDGNGPIRAARVQARAAFAGATWVDLVEVPPGRSIGRHRHSSGDEEIYVCIDGTATMEVDGQELAIGPGDVVVNRPGGTHGLLNTGSQTLRLVVVDTAVREG
jgi:quercetin dioxygenase-like cupin family protein